MSISIRTGETLIASSSDVVFFIASIPIIPPGINQSYAPARNVKTGSMMLVHTPVAKRFLRDVSMLLADSTHAKLIDPSLFNAISYASKKVPLSMMLSIYYPTLWQHDIDGCEKIVTDGLFTHFKKIAVQGDEKSWNDNRIVEKTTRKFADKNRPRFELSIACATR